MLFTFFYALVTFNQQNIAENLQKNGGFIPGIRPGSPTQSYLSQVMVRITWGGAIFLAMVAVMPFIAGIITNVGAASTIDVTGLSVQGGVTAVGVITASSYSGSGANLTNVNAVTATVADESSDTTCFPLFATTATGDQALKSDSSALTYNSGTGNLII